MPVKLGFLGFGIMGERLLRAALDHDASTVVISGIFDPNPAAAERVKCLRPDIPVFGRPEELIEASDCLHIASPPSSHLDYLHQCLQSGRAALCEKPLATDVAAATQAVAALSKGGARAAVNFPFVSSLAVDQLQHWLADGVIGTPERIDIELAFAAWPRSWQVDAARWLDGRREGGFTREVASHFLFLSRRLIGPLELRSAVCSYPITELSERHIEADLVAGTLPLNMIGSVGVSTKGDHNIWMLTGSTGRIRLRDWSCAEREVGGIWQAPTVSVAPTVSMSNEKARPLVLARQLDKVVALTRGAPTNLATLSEALDVQEVVEAILKASDTVGQKI